MSDIHFHPPTRDVLKSKVISAACLMIIILALYGTCYLLFFRTTGVDVTADIEILYRGENGSGSVLVKNKNEVYNQRIREFMDTVTYKVTPNQELKNGDTITIEASYDKSLASRYHIDPDQLTKEVVVANLPVRYANVRKIPQTLLDKINKSSQSYMDKNMDSILSDDFTSFYVTSEATLVNYRRSYRVFLNANDANSKDKILDIYAITASGDVNTSNEKEKLVTKEVTIYYMITYNEINTGNRIANDNIYGEKIITTANQDLSKEADFTSYMNEKYGEGYLIERIE